MTNSNHWDRYWKNWSLVRSPLRPCPEDIAHFSCILSQLPTNPRILILGVTSEILLMDWPNDAMLFAMDNNINAIKGLWQKSKQCNSNVICGDWKNLPLKDQTFDLIIGDGIITTFKFPNIFNKVIFELHRTLKAKGKLVLRHFLMENPPLTEKEVWAKAYDNQYMNFSAFKWRLAHSLQQSPSKGVRVEDILDSWEKHVPFWKNKGLPLPWPKEEIATIEVYRNSPLSYVYLDDQGMELALQSTFIAREKLYGHYELSELCPVIVYDKK